MDKNKFGVIIKGVSRNPNLQVRESSIYLSNSSLATQETPL